jgi:hypothetical protein
MVGSGFANFLVVLIHALDGSDEVARMDKLATATRRLRHQAHRLDRRAVGGHPPMIDEAASRVRSC